eukprot:1221237-Rhodomonas_salina.1
MPFGNLLNATDWNSLNISQAQQVIQGFSLTVPRRRALRQDGTTTASDATALASEIWNFVQDCPAIEERDVCLASLGLDPAMPWESMGICVGFANDCADPPDDLNKVHPQTVRAMDEQIHKISLSLNPAYHRVMEFLQDDHLLNMEESRASPHHTESYDPILSLSLLFSPWSTGTCALLFTSGWSCGTTRLSLSFSPPLNLTDRGHCCLLTICVFSKHGTWRGSSNWNLSHCGTSNSIRPAMFLTLADLLPQFRCTRSRNWNRGPSIWTLYLGRVFTSNASTCRKQSPKRSQAGSATISRASWLQ